MNLKIENREDEGIRIDKYVKNMLSHLEGFTEISRNEVVNTVFNYLKVNGKEVKPSYRLKNGDKIEIEELELKEKLNRREEEILPEVKELRIIDETENYLVINKESGISTHPSKMEKGGTLANYVKAYLSTDLPRAGIVHRLDKPVSGLILIAKNMQSLQCYMEQFERHSTLKVYIASVENRFEIKNDWKKEIEEIQNCYKDGRNLQLDNWIKVEGNISRDSNNRLRMKIDEGKGKYVCSYILPIDSTKVLVLIKTGRMHQIRATIKSIGLNIEGDTLYSSNKGSELPKNIGLHAVVLGFKDLDGNVLIYNILDKFI